jgi:glyoxylase-like metal-dependent hydrolase (beta-lactamase superfamily II)
MGVGVRRSMWTSEGHRRIASRRPPRLPWRFGLAATLTLITAAVAAILPDIARAAGWQYKVVDLKPGVFAWLPDDIIEADGDPQYRRAGNAGFVITPDGVLVVNATNSPFHAREVLYEIRHRTEAPVRYVIDTGSASDETMGNQVFADLKANILSTPRIQAEIRDRGQALLQRQAGSEEFQHRLRGIHITPPNQTFESTAELTLGGQTIRVIAFAGLDAVAVQLPSARVVFLGDLFQNHYVPKLDSRNVGHWIEALREAEALDADVYVPGHGDPGSKQQLRDFRGFLEWLTHEIQTRQAKGMSLNQTEGELLPFRKYPWHAAELQQGLVEDLYEQLAGRANAATPH